MDIDYTPDGWAKNIALITKLGAENELLQLKLDDALAQLRLYKAELHNAEMLRRQLMNDAQLINDVFSLRLKSPSNAPAIVIPIREVVA